MIYNNVLESNTAARKARDKVRANLLTTLIGEAQTRAKNQGVEILSDDEMVKLINSFLKNIRITMEHTKETVSEEADILNEFLPTMMTDAQIRAKILSYITLDNTGANMGQIMGHLKVTFPGQYDGKRASVIVKEYV